MRKSTHTTTTTTTRSVAWYGVSKHKLIYPCPIGNTEENMALKFNNRWKAIQKEFAKLGGKNK